MPTMPEHTLRQAPSLEARTPMTTKTKRAPVQLRWTDSNARHDEKLTTLAQWARENAYWYAERWPLLPGYMETTQAWAHETKEAMLKAIAIGTAGIVAVREGATGEQGSVGSDDIAVRLETFILRNMRDARKRIWRRGKCIVPIRIATITRGRDRDLDDENAFTAILDARTMREWQACWKPNDTIEPLTAREVWECFLPRTEGKPETASDTQREDILRQALSPSTTHATTATRRAQAAGLRSVLAAMDGERGLHEEPMPAETLGPTERAIAREAIESVYLRHLNVI